MYIYDKNDRIVGKDDGITEKVIWSIRVFVLTLAALILSIVFFVLIMAALIFAIMRFV